MTPSLCDDELIRILNFLNVPFGRHSFSRVNKHCLKLEALTRSSLNLLDIDYLPSILPRFPNLVQFQYNSASFSDHNLNLLAQHCPNLQFLDLSFNHRKTTIPPDELPGRLQHLGDDVVRDIASGCRELSAVSLRRRPSIGDTGVVSLCGSARNLTVLDLRCCSLVTDDALEAIGNLCSIQVLKLQHCYLITDRGLEYLTRGSCSDSLRTLVLGECDRITDYGVCLLQGLQRLEELDLSECGLKVTDVGIRAISGIQSLRRLKLSWLVNLSDAAVVALAERGRSLVEVNFTGCELISGIGIRAFASHGSLESLNVCQCYNVGVQDLEYVVLRCKSLRCLVLGRGLKPWMTDISKENIEKFCHIRWK